MNFFSRPDPHTENENESANLTPKGSNAKASVILLHGLCSTQDEMLSLYSALKHAGHPVHHLAIDGYSFDAARSQQQAVPFERWIDAVERKVDEVRAQTESGTVILAGISAGTSLALGATIRCGSRISGLVLLSTSLLYDGWSIPPWRFLLPLALYTPLGRLWRYRESPPYGVKNERVRQWISDQLSNRRISSAGAAVIGVSHLREHDRLNRFVKKNLRGLRCPPLLAIHARDDEVTSPANVELLRSQIECSSFRFVELNNSYHMVTLDNDRRQVAQETLAFAGHLSMA